MCRYTTAQLFTLPRQNDQVSSVGARWLELHYRLRSVPHQNRRLLRALVVALPDEAVAQLVADLRISLNAGDADRHWQPAVFGMGANRDGRSNLSECVGETLASGFGAPRP